MPIKSLEEARRTFDMIMLRVLDFRHRAETYKYSPTDKVPLYMIMEVRKQIDELLNWRNTFDHFFRETWKDQEEKHRPGASATKISYHWAYILISTSLEASETAFDSYFPHFQEIVTLSRYLLQTKRSSLFHRKTFMLDSVICVPLFIVAMKCRDSSLRREANALLESSSRRGGFWDSAFGVKVAEWIISIEEDGLDPDQVIPECNRFRMCDVKCDLQERTGWARCRQRFRGTSDYVNLREATFSYD
jgi:hypothetical protein